MSPQSPLTSRVAVSFRTRLDAEVDEILTLAPGATETDAARARDQVVLAALPIAESIARRYRGRGAERDDLLQVARLGLVKAVRGFQVGSPAGFSAYAIPTISGEIKRYFRDHQWIVRPPRSLLELQQRVARCRNELAQINGRIPSDDEVGVALGIDPRCVTAARLSMAAYRAASDDVLRDMPQDDDRFDRVLDRLAVQDLLEDMGPRDAKLLWLRFMEGRSQASIARELGVSQMQVSRLLSGLLHRLRLCAEERAR
ncbi:sigma-70 family RNA polymerase sigma factor [Granulicoccus sp. GXG6511]|uniref:sigma-70 family RNA polymerase sigma factor n=1 Tax=Granulicoccus sp. GXG6511 TaxID=3381351 RepID=UPI003D7EE807